ncbi:MAG: CvpA family protein [Deltaproteobacteria bacterium]|nr:CvpA family protein [Deltaproteobacteria bacterium]
MGIAIDILVILFLVWSLVRGWRYGLLYQIGYLALMVVSYFVARLLSGALGTPIAKALGAAPIVGSTIAFFVVLLVLLVIGSIVVRKITKDLVPDTSVLSAPNRLFGALVSGAKGALIAFVILVFLLQIQRITNKVELPIASSFTLRFAADHNFLERGSAGALAKIVWLVGTGDRDKLAADPRVQRLLVHPKAAALTSPEVLAAIGRQDYVALLSNSALWDFLEDEQVQAELEAIPW